jgi:hypothetical protein
MKSIHHLSATLSAFLLAGALGAQTPTPPYTPNQVKARLDALCKAAAEQSLEDVAGLLGDCRADDRFAPDARFAFDLIDQGLGAIFRNATLTVPKAPADLTPEQIAQAHFAAARIFVAARKYPIAQFFAAIQQKEVPRYVCEGLDAAPIGVYGWKHAALVRDPARRESRFEVYNQKAAALLINDVNTVRETATAQPAETCGVSFFAVADPRGLHCYIESRDDRVDEVLAGLQNGGMFEMYLQPGAGRVYHQWMVNVQPKKVDVVDWMSPNRHFRSLRNYLTCEVAPIPEGFGIAMTIPWTALYDTLPADGDEWAFGVIPWMRNGGFTWGSGQVHELNRFGRLQFKGLGAQMPAIRRQIVLHAWGKYKREAGDIKTFWSDEQRGDRAFDAAVLQPFVAQLEALGAEVKADMDTATVDKLFREAVPSWNEFALAVAERRETYLRQKLLAGE